MWETKIEAKMPQGAVAKYALKYGVTIIGYPVNWYEHKGKTYLVTTGLIKGKNIEKAITAMRKDKDYLRVEYSDSHITTFIRISKEALDFDKNIIFLRPVIILPDATEIIEIGAHTKKDSLRVYNDYKKVNPDTKLKWIKYNKKSIITTFSLGEPLTEKQSTALNLAKQNGYYDYPHKITIEELAKIMKISRTTFQEHLRKAERKVIMGKQNY